jgi:hypothetical protein
MAIYPTWRVRQPCQSRPSIYPSIEIKLSPAPSSHRRIVNVHSTAQQHPIHLSTFTALTRIVRYHLASSRLHPSFYPICRNAQTVCACAYTRLQRSVTQRKYVPLCSPSRGPVRVFVLCCVALHKEMLCMSCTRTGRGPRGEATRGSGCATWEDGCRIGSIVRFFGGFFWGGNGVYLHICVDQSESTSTITLDRYSSLSELTFFTFDARRIIVSREAKKSVT